MMTSRARTVRIALASTLAATALGVSATSASADHDLIKISEFYGGSSANAFNDSFIELQMYAPGQNNVSDMVVRFFNTAGMGQGDFGLTSDAPNGDNQRTIVVGDTAVAGGVDYPANLSAIDLSDAAACYLDPLLGTFFDCIAWGSYMGVTGSPFFMGTPEPGLPFNTTSITRQIGANCPTALDGADDTDDSAADFATVPWTPRRNTVTPTETECPPAPEPEQTTGDTASPDTQITKGPPAKTKKGAATFEFTGTDTRAVTGFQCKLDSAAFVSCTSPYTVKVKKGKHTLQVRAIDQAGNIDPTPATDNWRVKKKRKK